MIVATLLLGCAYAQGPQKKETGFCASRTPLALHSPRCKWAFVVGDPHQVANVKIPHEPIYHTYSRWVLGDKTYIFAYRDIDQQPEDMAADIYIARDARYKLVGSIRHLGEIVTGVFEAKLTGSSLPDIVFREDCGELQCLVVVRFSNGTPRQVFWYGASIMHVVTHPRPLIIAKSSIPRLVEEFAWDPKSGKLVKIRQYVWHKAR
jgi:hypothetical protein